MQNLLLILGAVLIVFSWMHLIRYEVWWIRAADFPHLQLAVPLLVIFVAYLIWFDIDSPKEYVFIYVTAITLIYHLYRIRPYTRLHSHQVLSSEKEQKSGDGLKLLIFNVFMDNTRCDEFLQQVYQYNPDIVLAVETNQHWMNKLKPLEKIYAYRVSCPLENTYGMLFYSRFPIKHKEINFLVQDDIPSLYVQLTLPSKRVIDLYGVHPRPPAPGENNRSTERDVELIQVGKRAKVATNPVIVAGDLNDVAWSHTTRLFQRLSGLLDPRIGRGFFNTFNAKYWLLRWPLDHVFVSHHFKLIDIERLPNCGSDHFPMFAHFCYEPDPEAKENKPQAEASDYKEANEKEQQLEEEKA
ncbi:endonuclease/exonuclease/phosphatase family protein [Cytophagaceae bacterium YF14B1]|uniref:Endonuclease/exonuclease/phosphatase family protein n=1 Tax=Xanthocytophaga flava TaxID=3048013 RepID=A0AAE3U8H0_9BACT|nr:endonuclease/exonuclease/phosphatase family protein [Xanthocytophaga flavus]MDJ1480679.1 endonuclease/exonuclease/phosphatase family protein [Xanthocytophaga flavus]